MNDPATRAYTTEETAAHFLDQIRAMVNVWTHDPRPKDLRARLDGLVFSILVILDGESDLPGFQVKAAPHPDDKAFRQGQGQDWYPPVEEASDIAGSLHDLFFRSRAQGQGRDVTSEVLGLLIARLVPIWRAQRGPGEPHFSVELDDGTTATLTITPKKG